MTRDVILKALRDLSGSSPEDISDNDLLYKTASEYKRQGKLGEVPELENEYNKMVAESEAGSRGFFGDVYAAGKRGLAQGRQSFNVLQGADDPTNAQDIADAQKTIDLNPVSEKYREFQATSKDDTLGWLAAFAKNPITITSEVITESLGASLPSMVGGIAGGAAQGALVGAAALNPVTAGIGAAIGAGAGSFAVEYASKTLDVMRDKGMDLSDPASIRSFFSDPVKLAEAKDLAVKRAIPVGVFDAATAGLAGRFLRPLSVAKEAGEKVAISRILGATAKEVGLQATGGMLGEVGGQVASGEEIDPRSIFLEGIAEVGSAPAEIRSNLSDIRGTKPTEAVKAQPYTEENAAATTAKAAIKADIPDVNPFFTAPAEAMQAAAAAEAGVAPTVESIAAKVMAGNTNFTQWEIEYATVPEVSQAIQDLVQSTVGQRESDAAQKRAIRSARGVGGQMKFGQQDVIEASRTVGEPVIGEIDSTPGDVVPVEDAPGQETMDLPTDKQIAAIQAKEALQATKEKAKADKLTAAEQLRAVRDKAAEVRSRVVRVPRSEFRANVAPAPTPAPEGTIPFPVDAAAKRVRERAALVRNADDAEFIDFTTGEKMDVPLAAAPDTTVPFAPAATTPVETVAVKPTATSTPVAAATPPTETTPAPVSATIPSADDLVESSLNLPADIKTVKERVEGLLAAVAEKADGTVHLLPLVRGEDGATYVKQISNFENKGELVDALAESYAGQKGFSKPSLRKLIINEAPFTADGKVNQEQMLRLYGNPATRAKWTPVVQRALDMGVLGVGSKRTKLSEYLAANEMVSSGTAAVTKTPLKNPTRISSPLESITAKARTEPAMTAGGAVNISAIAAKLPKKRVGQVVERLSLEKTETLEQINALLVSKPEEAQAEIDRVIGVVKGDTPKYRVSLFAAGYRAKQIADAVASSGKKATGQPVLTKTATATAAPVPAPVPAAPAVLSSVVGAPAAATATADPTPAPAEIGTATATPVPPTKFKKDRPKVRAPEVRAAETPELKTAMSAEESGQLKKTAGLVIDSTATYVAIERRLSVDGASLYKKVGSPEYQEKLAALLREKLRDGVRFKPEGFKPTEDISDAEDITRDEVATDDALMRVQPDVAKAREGLRYFENPEQYLAPKDGTLLDRIVYAMAERGLKVSIAEATKEMKAGGAYSPSKRTVALVLDSIDNPSKQSVITALHEITHDILADAPEDIHRAIHDVIERTPNGQLAFYNNPEADPRLATGEGMTKEELAIERAVEHLALQNIDREYSRGLLQAIFRTAKELFLRAAIYLQKKFMGADNTSGRLAKMWVNNELAKVLAGDAQTFDRFLSQFGVKPTLADVVRMSTDERGRTFSMKADFTGRSITYRPIRSLDSAELNIDAALASAKETAKANGTWNLDIVLGELEKTLGPAFARVQPGEFEQYNGNLAVQRVLAEARSSVAVANSLHPIVEKFYQKVKSVQTSYTPAQKAAMKRLGVIVPSEITSVEDLYKVLRMADPRQRAAQIYEHAKTTLESEFGTTLKEDLFDRTVTIEKLEKGVVADMADQMLFRELVRLNNKTSSRIDGLKMDIQGLRLASEKNQATIRSVMDALSDISVTRRLLDRSIAEQFREIRRDLKLSSENAEAMGEAAGILEALEGETKRRDLSARFNEKLFEGIVIDELPLNSYFKSLDEVLKARGLILAESNVKDIRSAVIAAVRANPDIALKDLVSLGEGPMAKDRGTALLTTLIGFSKNEKLVSEIIRVQMTRGEERVAAINELRRVHGEVSEKVLSGLAEDIKNLSKPTANFDKLGTTHATPTTTAAQRLLNARDEALMSQTRLARMERDLSVLNSANSIFDQLVNVADQRLKIGSSFVLSNGSNFINAGAVTDTDDALLEGSKANKLTLYGSGAMSNDQLRDILQRNREWIDARRNSPEEQGRVYNSLERQNEEMSRFIFGSQARELITGIRNGYFTNLAELSARTGTAGGARMASALTQFVGWQRIFRAEAEVAGKKFERARADFEKASGVDPSTFKTLFYDTARWFMDTYAGSEKDAFTELNKRFRENVSASRYWSKPGAPEAFFALMRSVKENAAIQNKWMSITGANRVADDRLTDVNVFDQKTSQPMERRQLETGVSGYTTYRNLNESLSGWSASFRLKIEGDGKNNPFADLKLKTDLTQQTATLSAQLKALFNDNDWSVFLNPILLNETGGVPGPRKADGVRSQTSPRVVAEAVSMAGNDLIGIADRIYAAEGGNPEGAAAYRSQFLTWIYGRWQQVDRITQKEIPTGQNISLRTPSMGVDARTSQFMPREWLTYPQYTPEDHSRAAHAIASTGSFGRNAEVLTKAIKDVVEEIAVKKNEIAAAGEGLNPDAVDNEAWLAFKKKNPTEYKRLKEIAEYRPPNFAEIYSDVLNTEGEFWTQWHTSREVFAAMTTGMTAGLKSAVKNLVSTSNLFAIQKSGSGDVFKTVGGAYAKTGKLFLGSITQIFGLDLYKNNAALQAMMRIGAFDSANHATFKDNRTGERGVNDSMTRFATFLRKMRQVFSNQKLSIFEGGTAPAIRLLNPFQYTQQLVNMANTWQLIETYMDMAQSAASVYRADPKSSRAMTAKDAGMTDEVAFKARIELLQNNGYSLDDLARKVAQGRDPFDAKLIMAANNISTTQLANEGSAISRPVGLTRSKSGQVAGTFVGWSIEQTNRVLRLLETPEGRMNVGSVARGLGVLGITMLPATLAYAALLDEWDELVEKKQNRRPVSDGPSAWLEATTSVGTFGLVAELADYVSSSRQGSSGYNDALSLDNRIVLISSARQMAQSIRNVVQADVENTNYANIIRPFLQAAGAGGIIQNAYVLDRVLGNQLQELPVVGGVVKAEASVALRSNVLNYLRVSAREAGLEVRSQGGGAYAITPMTPHITDMALAAFSGDNEAFQQAYRDAIVEARKKHSDPFKAVQLAFAARHPYKTLINGTPTAQEVMKIRQSMPEAGQEAVDTALRNYTMYASRLGIPPFMGSTGMSDAQMIRMRNSAQAPESMLDSVYDRASQLRSAF